MKRIIFPQVLFLFLFAAQYGETQTIYKTLPVLNASTNQQNKPDWLLGQENYTTHIFRSKNNRDLIIANGLVSRTFRIYPYFACYSYKNLMTGKEMLRAILPEAEVTINEEKYKIGGIQGQFEYAYLDDDWLKKFTKDSKAFQFSHFRIQSIQPRFPWKPKRWNTGSSWPPQGKEIIFYFNPPRGTFRNIGTDSL